MLPVEQLYALQRMDTRLATLRRALDALDPGKSLEALLEQVRSAEEVTATQLRETQARLRDLELSLSSTAMGFPDSSRIIERCERARLSSRTDSLIGGKSDTPQNRFGSRRLG